MKFTTILTPLVLANVALASLNATTIVAEIAPGSESCASDNADCRTASVAGPYLALAMQQYHIYSVNQMAAVISLMAFESVDFAYKHNISPGRPGQGTANMQTAGYNLLYAKSLDGVKDKVADIDSVDGLSDDKLNEILALVTPDKYNFGSGAWFLTTQCDASVRTQLDADIDAGFEAYMGCVGTALTDERTAFLTRAKEAFGIN
ncbi:hypothetical protein B0J13DRAFT_539185 [Dactylonectria estremocensis]|uniref:Uncharacterized protein n=1 Tax=Dactylonectria estremocensis TaxID=1079267 RepID=A0A9P9FCY8_9HYPO|nr:hypothetical protein B0J13DRAFT_539185 [Dactylonectria estremocensis]